ncbi:MAG: putative AAA domain-containing protein [Anaerolineae bacterium]|nr:putative AAA domain-containing protein [Anaerolineae bacterium]
MADIERLGNLEIPNHLKDSSRDSKALGHGKGYKYPHDFENHFVAQQYLPDGVRDKIYYTPGALGDEIRIAERLRVWRAQMGKEQTAAHE